MANFFWTLGKICIDAIYTSEKNGSDENGKGTESAPFKTIFQAMRHAGKEPFPTIYVDAKSENAESPFEPAAKSQLKKIQKLWAREVSKNADKSKREEEDAKKREVNLEEAKKIELKEDPSWPQAKEIKIRESVGNRDIRVKVYGWVCTVIFEWHMATNQNSSILNSLASFFYYFELISRENKLNML